MKFARSARVSHSRVNPVVFGNHRPNRTADMGGGGGKCAPKISFLGFSKTVRSFLRKKLGRPYSVPPFPKKKLHYIHFCRPTPGVPSKWNSRVPKFLFLLALDNTRTRTDNRIVSYRIVIGSIARIRYGSQHQHNPPHVLAATK